MTTPDVVGKIGGSDAAVTEAPTATATEQKATRPLPTDRLAFNNQLNVIRAYGLAAGENSGRVVTATDLARLTGLNQTSVGLNNTFMADLGLITKAGNGYNPNADVVAYARAHTFAPETAAHRLAPTLRRSWFGDLLIPRLLMGRATTEGQALSDLAVAVSATPEHTPRLQQILEYLTVAGLITRDGGLLKAGPTARPDGAEARSSDAGPAASPDATPAAERNADRVAGPTGRVQTAFSAVPMGGIDFTVAVKVDLLEMATWKPEAVATFFEGLAKVISAKAMVERDSAR